jgi:hypothetical protein
MDVVPREATDMFKENYEESNTTFEHPLIGTAKFYNIVCKGLTLKDTAWYYPDPKPDYEEIRNHVAFRGYPNFKWSPYFGWSMDRLSAGERWQKDILRFQAGSDDGSEDHSGQFWLTEERK